MKIQMDFDQNPVEGTDGFLFENTAILDSMVGQELKLATVEIIDSASLDELGENDVITAGGLQMVAKKGMFALGDRLVVVHENAVFPQYGQYLGSRKEIRHLRRSGFVVKPITVKGIVSEAFPLHISLLNVMEPDLHVGFLPNGFEVSHILRLGYQAELPDGQTMFFTP